MQLSKPDDKEVTFDGAFNRQARLLRPSPEMTRRRHSTIRPLEGRGRRSFA
jgi:hypothetical protein